MYSRLSNLNKLILTVGILLSSNKVFVKIFGLYGFKYLFMNAVYQIQ